jgi:hypothetical protein
VDPATQESQFTQNVSENENAPDAWSVDEQLTAMYCDERQVEHFVQTTSENAVPALVKMDPEGHVLYGVHTVSVDSVQFCDANDPDGQDEQAK